MYKYIDDTSWNPTSVTMRFWFNTDRQKLVSGVCRGGIKHGGALKNCDYFCRDLNPSRADTDNTLLQKLNANNYYYYSQWLSRGLQTFGGGPAVCIYNNTRGARVCESINALKKTGIPPFTIFFLFFFSRRCLFVKNKSPFNSAFFQSAIS